MPLRPLRAGEPITEDWIADLVDAVAQALTVRGAGGLAVTRSGNGITIRNDKPTEFALVELNETIQKNDKDKHGDLFRYDHSTTDPWSDTSDVLPLISDPDQGLRLQGERHLVYHNPSAGQFIPIPGSPQQFGKIYAQPGGAGQAYDIEVWKVTSTNTPPAAQTTATSTYHVYAYQWGNQNLPNGTQVFVWQHRQSKLWIFTPGWQGSVALGVVTTKITSGTGLGGTNGTGVVELYNLNGVDLSVSVTVANIGLNAYAVGDVIRIIFDSASGQWYPLDLQNPAIGIVTSGTTDIADGSTGSVTLQDDQGNTIATLTGVRAITHLVRQQKVLLYEDHNTAEIFALPLNTPLIAKALAAVVWQNSATQFAIKQSDETDPGGGGVTISAYAFYRTIAKGEYCLLWWDFYKGQMVAVPLNAVLLGQFSASNSIAAGSTGTVELFKPNTAGAAPVDLSTSISNVRAITDWNKYDFLWLVWDQTNNEFYGLPLDRPILGKPSSNIAAGGNGSMQFYDSAGSVGTTFTVYCTVKVPANVYAMVSWDWHNARWSGMPLPILIRASMILGGCDLTDITGYDGTKNQFLMNIAGTLTWVTGDKCP